jgi:hypothetical protein
VSIDTANLLWLAVVSLAAASLLLLLTVVVAAACRGVADGVSKDEGLLQQSGGPATRLGAADPAIGLCKSAEEVAAREHAAVAHPSSRTVVADMIVTAMFYILYFVIKMLY